MSDPNVFQINPCPAIKDLNLNFLKKKKKEQKKNRKKLLTTLKI